MRYVIPQLGSIRVKAQGPPHTWAGMRWVSTHNGDSFLVPEHFLVAEKPTEPLLVGTVVRVGTVVFVRLVDGALPVMAWGRIGHSRPFDWDEVVAAIGNHELEIWEPSR